MNIMATWFPGRSAAEVGGGVAVGFRHHGRGWCGVGVGWCGPGVVLLFATSSFDRCI